MKTALCCGKAARIFSTKCEPLSNMKKPAGELHTEIPHCRRSMILQQEINRKIKNFLFII